MSLNRRILLFCVDVGPFYLPCLCSRFRSRSHQFAALHLSSIMQIKTHKYRATDPWLTRFRKRSADGTSKSKQALCVSPEISDRVLVEWSTGAHGPEAGTDVWEIQTLHSLQTDLLLVAVAVTVRIAWWHYTGSYNLTLDEGSYWWLSRRRRRKIRRDRAGEKQRSINACIIHANTQHKLKFTLGVALCIMF